MEKAVVAVFTIAIVFVVDSTLSFLVEPRFNIETNHKERSCTIKIIIKDSFWGISTSNIEKIFIEYPIMGTITDFGDMNPITKAKSNAFVVGSNDPTTMTNHLQLQIYDIAPKASLDYTFHWEPVNTGRYKMVLFGFDRYKIRYAWKYKGNEISRVQWRKIENDKIIKPKAVIRIYGGQFSTTPLPTQKTIPKRKLE